MKSKRRVEEFTVKGDPNKNSLFKWWRVRNPAIFAFNTVLFQVLRVVPSLRLKNLFYKLAGVKVGKNVAIAGMVRIGFYYPKLITLKDNCIIGWNALILEHESVRNVVRKGPVVIGKNALVGADAIVLCGVTIGDNAMVGAGSVVTKDVPANTFVAGNPAKFVKKIK